MGAADISHLLQRAPAGVHTTDTVEGLSAIHRPGCAATVWHRRPLQSFQTWIDALDPALLPSARVILRPSLVRESLSHICDQSGTPDCAERERLIGDVAALADYFAGVMQAPYVRLRLDVVTTDACRKFHTDVLTARLVCTYRGLGTQYGTASQDDGDPEQIFSVGTGEPIILRGKRWPEQPASGLRHRSPPIEGTGQTRLVLVLDPMNNPEGG